MSDEKAPDIVQEALDRFDLCVTAEDKQRKREKEALEFQVPELQWPAEIRDARKQQTVGGVALAARPMLSIPKLEQPIQLVENQERSAHLGVQIHPMNEEADDDTAEVLQGLYRAIEVDSRASLARSWAFQRLVRAGQGCWRIVKEYDETSDHPSDQKIVLKKIYEQGSVYFDAASTEPDGSDSEYALVVGDVPWRTYKRLYPDSTLATYSNDDFVALGNDHPGWVTGDDEGRAIRVCEYFYIEHKRSMEEWDGGSREKDKKTVHWCKLNAVEELETAIWDGQYIPLVRIARELIPFDGERRSVGIIEPNMGAQRMFNYAASETVALASLESKASQAIDPQQIEGYEAWWQQRNIRNFPYLPYRRFVDGVDFGPPVPVQADMSKMQINAMLLSQAGEFIHAGTATFEPSLGNQSPNVRTKGATLALQQQSEQANSHWIQILADIGMTHEARIVLDLIPHVYDRPGRIARILDSEDNPKQVMFNQPFTMQGKKPMAVPPPMPGQPPPQGQPQQAPQAKHYDLTKGRYGVTVSIGKAYKSRVEQGQDQLGQIIQGNPELLKFFGDIYFQFADFPGHKTVSERFKKLLPPQLQEKDQQQDTAQQLDQAKAAIAQMEEKMKELEPERMKAEVQIKTAQAKSQADAQIAEVKTKGDVEIARMNNATKVLVARITAAKEAMDASKEDLEERIALAATMTHETDEAALDRQHDRDTMEHQAAMAAAQTGAAAGEAQRGREHDVSMADQAAAHASDAAEQQAELAPEPAAE